MQLILEVVNAESQWLLWKNSITMYNTADLYDAFVN